MKKVIPHKHGVFGKGYLNLAAATWLPLIKVQIELSYKLRWGFMTRYLYGWRVDMKNFEFVF